MNKHAKRFGLSVLAVGSIHLMASCLSPYHKVTVEPSVVPDCTVAVVQVTEDQPVTCNLTPPQRLDIIKLPGTDSKKFIAYCNENGGEPIFNPNNRTLVCENVDY